MKLIHLLLVFVCAVGAGSIAEEVRTLDPSMFGADALEREAWQEWVEAFSKAEEIEFRRSRRGQAVGENRKVADPKILKLIAAEVANHLEASEVEEWGEMFEVRVKGFQPKKSAFLWVSVSEVVRPGPEGLKGHVFLIGYRSDEGEIYSGTSVGTKDGKTVPALGEVLCDAAFSFGYLRFKEAEEKSPTADD